MYKNTNDELELETSSEIKTELDITIVPGQTLQICEWDNLISQTGFETNFRITQEKRIRAYIDECENK